MTELVIDEATGLPHLEDALWKIEEYEDTLVVFIVQKEEIWKDVEHEVDVPKWFWLWGTQKKTVTKRELVTVHTALARKVMRDTEDFFYTSTGRSMWSTSELSKEDNERVRELRAEGWDAVHGMAGVIMKKDWELTKENVLKAAEICMEKYTADREEKFKQAQHKQMVDSLVGLYPPKKLD